MLRTIRVDFGPITKPRDASLKIFRKYRKDFNTVYICSWQHQKKNTDQLCHATYQHKQFLIFSFQFMITTKKSPNKKLNNTFTCYGRKTSALSYLSPIRYNAYNYNTIINPISVTKQFENTLDAQNILSQTIDLNNTGFNTNTNINYFVGDDISATGRTQSTILSCNLRQNKHIYPLVSVLDPLTQKKTNLQ